MLKFTKRPLSILPQKLLFHLIFQTKKTIIILSQFLSLNSPIQRIKIQHIRAIEIARY
jgi:hypothetical protein